MNVKQAYADYLQTFEWTHFYTLTFRRERRDVLAASRDVKEFFREKAYFQRAFVAVEPHTTGALHVHGLGYTAPPVPAGVRWAENYATDMWRDAFKRFGRNKVEPIRGHHEAAAYCAKYVVKELGGFDYDFYGDKKYWFDGLLSPLPIDK